MSHLKRSGASQLEKVERDSEESCATIPRDPVITVHPDTPDSPSLAFRPVTILAAAQHDGTCDIIPEGSQSEESTPITPKVMRKES